MPLTTTTLDLDLGDISNLDQDYGATMTVWASADTGASYLRVYLRDDDNVLIGSFSDLSVSSLVVEYEVLFSGSDFAGRNLSNVYFRAVGFDNGDIGGIDFRVQNVRFQYVPRVFAKPPNKKRQLRVVRM